MKTKFIPSLLISLFFQLSFVCGALAQDELVTMKVEGTAKTATSAVDASRQIQASVTQDAVRDQTIGILGEKRYQKNKSLIESKIVRQANKVIPYVTAGEAVQAADGSWKMPVEMRLSPSSLRKMILDVGLLNDVDGPASILPMVALVDRAKGVQLHWWLGEPKDEAHRFLAQMSRAFHSRLQGELSRQGFHLVKPLGTQASPLPEAYRVEKPSSTDMQFLSEYFGTPMIMRGDVRFREAKDIAGAVLISVRLQVVQTSNGRTVAEVTRHFETDPGHYETVVRSKLASEATELSKDLANQVYEAWQRGALNANLVKLAVRGTLSPKQLAEFKSSLMSSVREVRGLKERSFENGQVLFEADVNGSASQLADKLKEVKMSSFTTKLATASDAGILVDVKAR